MVTMNITPLRTLALACVTGALLFAGSNHASAQVGVVIRVGTPPPPRVVEHPWARPYRDAVWIDGHHEWINGRWVWVGGYYAYPPRRGAVWVGGYWRHGYWHQGYWR